MSNRKGFTLIELMIVVAIIAIIAAIAIPGLLRARISANEGSAIGTLRTLSTSEAQYQSQAQSDQDADGTGEYGLLGELAGTVGRRTSGGNYNGNANPTFITPVLGPKGGLDHGGKSGYLFKLTLPGPVNDQGGTNAGVSTDNVVINAQETKFRAYAWPTSVKTTGMRCFAVDQAAEVLAAANVNGTAYRYSGVTAGSPTYGSAVAASEGDDTAFLGNLSATTGIDTQVWVSAGS